MKKIRPQAYPSVVFNVSAGFVDDVDSTENTKANIKESVHGPLSDRLTVRPAIGELGLYTYRIDDGPKLVADKCFGHLMRSKGESTQQGGVFMGHAVVDSVILYE